MYHSVAVVFSILSTSRLCGNIHGSYQHYQPGKITLHFPELIIEYLIATSYELWMILMTNRAEIIIAKSSICVW